MTASIYPDERSVSAGGNHAILTLEHPDGLELVVESFPVETHPTEELAEASVMRLAEERQATDVYVQRS